MTTENDEYYRQVRTVFDDFARTRGGYYDARPGSKHRHTLWQRLNRKHIESILSSLGRTGSLESCLDVGSGIGDFSHRLSRRLDLKRVHGVDFSPSVIDIARERYGQVDALSFSVGDVASGLSFSDREFDVVCCLNVFHHLLPAGQEAAIGHFCRVADKIVVLEVKRYHILHRLLTGYRAMGRVDIHAVRIPDVLAHFAEHGFRPVVIRPIFYFHALSPITILALTRVAEG